MFIVRCLFLLRHFLVVKDDELSKSTSHLVSASLTLECVRILSWSISFSTLIVRFLSELMIPLSTHHVINPQTCRNKLRWTINCNLILKIKISEKYFYFSTFFFIFKCQDLLLNVIRSSSNIKSCCPELVLKKLFHKLEIPTRKPVEFYKNVLWNQTFYSLQSIPILCIRKWCTHSDVDEFFPRQFPVFVFNFISRKSWQI